MSELAAYLRPEPFGAEHLSAEHREEQLRAAGLASVREVKSLVFNPNNAVTGVVERLALTDGTEVVRKVLFADAPTTVPHWAAGSTAHHWNYWRREADAYLTTSSRCSVAAPTPSRLSVASAEPSGALLETGSFMPTEGLRAPQLLGHIAPRSGVEVLFLEYVEGRSGPELGEADLASLAHGLGRWQGRHIVDSDSEPPRAATWWSRDWMWAYAGSRPPGPGAYLDDAAWSHPLVAEGFGDRLELIRRGFGAVYAELDWWQAIAAQLPVTPAHLDCWANNVIVPEVGLPVLFDWSFCGVAHVGADAGNLLPDGALDHYGDPHAYGQAAGLVCDAYLSGLAQDGWRGAEDVARLGMCLAPAKFAWLPALMVANVDSSAPTGYGGQPGLDPMEVFQRRAVVFEAMLAQVEEARTLVGSLGIAA